MSQPNQTKELIGERENMEISDFAHDLLGLQSFAERLEGFIPVEHHFVEGSLVIALSSKFGSGKSTFLKMWQKRLNAGGSSSFKPVVVELNAWESDYYGDPLFAIVASLATSLENSGDKRSQKRILDAVKDVGWMATALGAQVVDKLTGVDFTAAGKYAEEKRSSREADGTSTVDAFTVFECRKASMRNLQKAISNSIRESKRDILFLVDELDRCRPDYAIAYLETIKHIFNVPKATFILAIDRAQLENSAKTAFGPNLDFDEYLRKFVQREIALPPMSDKGCEQLTRKYFTDYLERAGLRHCYFDTKGDQVRNILDLLTALRPTPRQLQEAIRIAGHLMSTSEEKAGGMYWRVGIGAIAMAALRVSRPAVYHRLGLQEFDPSEAVDFLKSALGPKGEIEWWFSLFFTGGGLTVDREQDLNAVLVGAGLRKREDDPRYRRADSTWDEGWRDASDSRLADIYGRIEHIVAFG
jgi:hypothetical protein